MLLWGAPPAVTPNAVSGWGQFRLEFPRLRITRWMVLLLGAPPAVTPHAVSGRGQFRLLWARTLTRISSLLLVLVAGGQFRELLRREGVLRRLVLVFAVFVEGGRTHP